MKLTCLSLPAFLIAATVCIQTSRPRPESDDVLLRSGAEAIAGFTKTVSTTSTLLASVIDGQSAASILNAPRSMWGE